MINDDDWIEQSIKDCEKAIAKAKAEIEHNYPHVLVCCSRKDTDGCSDLYCIELLNTKTQDLKQICKAFINGDGEIMFIDELAERRPYAMEADTLMRNVIMLTKYNPETIEFMEES